MLKNIQYMVEDNQRHRATAMHCSVTACTSHRLYDYHFKYLLLSPGLCSYTWVARQEKKNFLKFSLWNLCSPSCLM